MAKKKKEDKDFEFEWDPIKYAKDGKQAQAVIWSTKVLEAAVEGMAKGLPLKANPFLGKNTKLLKPDLVFRRTEEEMADAEHCIEDPVFFASKCFLMTPEGLQPVVLRDYQVDYLRHLQKHRFSIFLSCRQSGKSFLQTNEVTIVLNKQYINYLHNKENVKKLTHIDYLIKTYYFYINDNNEYVITLPMFELVYMFNEHNVMSYLKYHLYKLIYKIEHGRCKGTSSKKTKA